MRTISYLTGNILFDGEAKVPSTASIRAIINDVTITNTREQVYEKLIEFDADSLSIFKYMPFELKDFEYDPSRNYELFIHVDINNNGQIEEGDYITEESYPIVTALEEINAQLTKLLIKHYS